MKTTRSVKFHDIIRVGSKKKRGKSDDNSRVDTSKLFDEKKCVIHLIDTSGYKNMCDDDCDKYNNNDTKDNEHYQTTKISNINKIITDQHMELWKMMKRGDLVEDINISGHITNGRFIVDSIIDNTKMDIIRHGLVIKDLERTFDTKGTILRTMHIITEFPSGYFDDSNLIVNDYLCPGEQPKSS